MQETYKIENRNWAAKLLAVVVVVTMVTSTFVLFAPEASARTGEEPNIGYTFKDQDSGAVYDWKELTTSSTATLLIDYTTDGAQGPYDFEDGFTFEMFTREYTTWGNSGDNGFITLGGTASSMWTPYRIPYAAAGTAIFGGWFDGGFCKSVDPLSGVYYDLQGTSPDREFIVQYQSQIHWSPAVSGCTGAGATDSLTWEIILHETSNEITVQWKDAKGGWSSDNEWLTSGIQGKTDDGVIGLEYVYRGDPAQVDHGDVVLYTPPPPMQNDLKLKSTIIPDPVSLAKTNPMGAEVFNNGVNCTPVDSCSAINETNIEVNAQVFSVAENVNDHNFDDRAVGDFVKMSGAQDSNLQGVNAWTTALNDGVGDYNVGDEDVEEDGAWSSGRKSLTMGGMFTDNQGIHASSDGNYLLVADKGKNQIVKVDHASHSSEVIIGPDTTNLRNVLDITDDGTHYYTLARAASTYSTNTYICKWDMSTHAMVGSCNTSNVKYGVSLTNYGGEVFALQGGSTSTADRKVIILDASDLTATGDTIGYYNGISAYSYANGIDVDDATGDMYISYRDYYGTVRSYELQSGGGYCITSGCYSQYYAYTRYHGGIDVEGGYAYTTGYYGSTSTYYGGMRKASTTTHAVTTMWSTYGDNYGYRGSLAVMADSDIYVATNYAYRYYSFSNYDDKVLHYQCSVSCNNQATNALGPNPASLSALSTAAIDTSSAIGMSMSFKVSWNVYYRYEGAYLEVSTDGATTWSHVGADVFTKGGYYGTTFNTYGNPLDITKDAWTYYNTNNAYTSYANDAPWKDQELSLDKYTGYDDVRFRWTVGFNQYNMAYYNSFFRLDDLVITVKAADVLYKDETQIIDTLGFKESANVDFFGVGDGNEFIPKDTVPPLSAGDSVAVLIKINNTNNDQKMANNRIIEFREIKYVMFADNFEDGLGTEWTTGSVDGVGSTDWAVRTRDAFGGSYSMDSGFKNPSGTTPGANFIASPNLDLSIAVSATAQFMMSYYGYYTYDGYQAQVSDDGWASYETIKPVDSSQYSTMINSAYWGNPLRGQLGYSYYGTSTGFTYEPDPQGWVKTELDLTPWVGQSDVQIRIVTGWSNLCCGPYYQTFYRFDDFAVTGVVHNNNVGLIDLDIPDPIEVGSTLPIGTSIVNAGLQDQDSGAAKMRMELGPMGVVALPELSDDLEYSSQGVAETAGWSTSTGTEGCNTIYSACGTWGLYGGISGFALGADDGTGVTGTQTSWGPNSNRDEFQMYYGGGSNHVETPVYDLSSAPDDLSLTLTHRYNFDYYSGYTSYNGGQVQISTDGGVTWAAIVPDGGYSGTMYNYAGYGNPLYGQDGFVHCGDCSGVSGSASQNADKYIDSLFDMKDYVGIADVRIKFVTGMYGYQWPGDGEHWQIGGLTFSGTGMDKVIFSETVPVVGTGTNGAFVSGESVAKSWDYTFIVPGMYKIVFDAWIGATPESGDDFLPDNKKSEVRETMFQVTGTTADGVRLTPKKNDEHYDSIVYSDEWTSSVNGGPKNSYKWQTTVDAATGSDSGSPVWWTGMDAAGSSYNGDDTSLTSPVFDLSRSTSAKFMMKHRFSMHGFEYDWGGYFYDGGRLEISTNAGETWSSITPTSGETYKYSIYSYAPYGHPFPNQPAFTMGSSGGGVTGTWVTSEVRLDDYTGDGFDRMQMRIRLGGTYFLNPTEWQVDDVGIYGLGFDLSQTGAESAPYTLELGESATISTQVRNQGSGDLGSGGLVENGYAFAYVCEVDLCADEQYTWTQSTSLGNLGQAYFEEVAGSDPVTYTTNAGSATSTIDFTYPGTTAPGVYTAGVRISSDTSGTAMSDLFAKNNEHEHMLIVGMSTQGVTLTADDTWSEVSDEPSYVGDALGTSWDKTALNTIIQDISILGALGGGYSPGDVTVQAGTLVRWTNNDNTAHTVTDREGNWAGSGSMSATESFTMVFSEVGEYTYFCEYHTGMEGTITVVADIRADKQVQTNYMKVWSADAYLVFWANFDLGSSDTITVYAQAKGAGIDDSTSIRLGSADGFNIVDGTDHDTVGDSLIGMSNGWNPYYMYLSTGTSTTNFLEHDPEDENEYSFVFRARGVEGSAEIGGVQVIRANEFGTFFSKSEYGKLSYDIFPSLSVEVDYFVKNTGIKDNTFQFTPVLILEGSPEADTGNWEIQPMAVMDGESVTVSGTSVGDDVTYSLSLSPDDEAKITIRFVAPAYNAETGLPAGNSKYNINLNPFDVNSNVSIRDDPFYNLYIKPSQFVLGEMSFDRQSVVEGNSLNITVKAWNEGNYASDVLVVMYAKDPYGTMVTTPDGKMRMTRIASTSVDVMEPKPVMEDRGEYKTWYEATATWDKSSIPGTSVQDYTEVDIYAWINPDPVEQEDLDKGFKIQDEYQDTTDDNSALGSIHIIKDKSSTPSFAVGLLGMSLAALVAAAGASLRREEE